MKLCAVFAGFLLAFSVITESYAQEPLSLDSCGSMIRYYKRHQLAVVPVMINDTLQVNLVLDPRCKTLVLFGTKFKKLLRKSLKNVDGHEVIEGELFTQNKVSFGPVTRQNLSIAVVPNRDPMNFFLSINGVIGYDMLDDFQIIMDDKRHILTILPREEEEVLTLLPSRERFH